MREINIFTFYLISFLSEYLSSKIAATTGEGIVQWSTFTIEQLYVQKYNYFAHILLSVYYRSSYSVGEYIFRVCL